MAVIRRLSLALVLVAACASAFAQSDVEAGLRMYRDGILPDGRPMTAIVAGDVPITGTQFSCESCHGRSGMGAAEGAYVVPPVSAQFLFAESPQPKRPAYDNASLARVLRDGVTPSGRVLSVELMPRYPLSDDDAATLSAYLATLSAANSPGVTETQIRFATVVSDGVDPQERDAVFAVFETFAGEKNRATRNDAERWDRGFTPESRLPTVFREWVIDEWRVTGPSDTWATQLERYYDAVPVFAMVGGLANGSWEPVARFCEQKEIPCLFPSTDQPFAEDGDFYTFYFSRGLGLEADLVASHARDDGVDRVVQVVCDPTLAPVVARLDAALQEAGIASAEVVFDCSQAAPDEELAARIDDAGTAAVLWLVPPDLENAWPAIRAGRAYLSSTLLDGAVADATGAASVPVFLAQPYRLPGSVDPAVRRFDFWARTRQIEVTNQRRQAEMYFACLVLNDAIKHIGRYFIRDFALDMLDHAQNLAAYLPIYPRPTLGPGQRFLSKGGYVLPVVDGQADTTGAEWILP